MKEAENSSAVRADEEEKRQRRTRDVKRMVFIREMCDLIIF